MIFIEKKILPYQKVIKTCGFDNTPADRLKIEIPIIKLSATYNKDNKVNKLVTLFAEFLQTWGAPSPILKGK